MTYRPLFAMAGRRLAHGHAHHAPAVPHTNLVDELKKKFPGQESAVSSRLEQLKRNHSKFLEGVDDRHPICRCLFSALATFHTTIHSSPSYHLLPLLCDKQ